MQVSGREGKDVHSRRCCAVARQQHILGHLWQPGRWREGVHTHGPFPLPRFALLVSCNQSLAASGLRNGPSVHKLMLPVLHAPPHHRSTRAQSKLIKRCLRAATGAMALLASALAFYWLLLRSPALGLPPATRSYDQQHVIRSTDQESSPVFNPGTVWVDQAGVPLQVGKGSPLPPSSLCSWWP